MKASRFSQGPWQLILFDGDPRFKSVLRRAFPACRLSHSFPDRLNRFRWGTYLLGAVDRGAVEGFLRLIAQHYCIFDDFDECHVLDKHWRHKPTGGFDRTDTGNLLYQAKPYSGRPGNRRTANEIAKQLAHFVQAHPAYARADLIVPVPAADEQRPFDFLAHLAAKIATATGIEDGTGIVKKVRPTTPQKNIHTQQEKVENVSGAFKLAKSVRDKRVIVLDDLYQSGATINEVGRIVREGKAAEVLGLAVTKTHRDV